MKSALNWRKKARDMKKDELYELFRKYKTDIFVETGSHLGYGIDRAIDLGYDEIHSIEIQERYYDACVEKFRNEDFVFLYFGNSVVQLPAILKNFKRKATFWLDAHMVGPGQQCPVLDELRAIKQHKVKNHTILIDDMRDFGTEAHDYISIGDLNRALLDINPAYEMTFESTGIKNNVLAATI